MPVDSQISYREFLMREFTRRQRRNSGYSLRAFARDLGIPAPKLSEALNNKCGFSPRRAEKIAQSLGLDAAERALFIGLVEQEHSRSSVGKQQAKEKVAELLADSGFRELDLERFKIISDWYHFAILELADVKGFQSSPSWIAKRLGISLKDARAAITRLLDFGLLAETKDGKWRQAQADLATPSGIPSREIREQHSQFLDLALHSLENDEITDRDFSAITLAFDAQDMERARKLIRDFRRQFNRELGSSPEKNRVYCIAIQFFPLDKRMKEQ